LGVFGAAEITHEVDEVTDDETFAPDFAGFNRIDNRPLIIGLAVSQGHCESPAINRYDGSSLRFIVCRAIL
jgi:hypothetical protein